MSIFTVVFGALVLAAGLRFILRGRDGMRESGDEVSDEMIQRIEEQGRIEVEDPLDLDEIREEEERFWEETWDEADEW